MAGTTAVDARPLLETLADRGGVFFVLGPTDVGKSTLARDLVRLVTARGQTAMVLDADVGQSTYGLPTTLNLVRFAADGQARAEPDVVASVFVGATSPAGHLLPTVVGCRRLRDRASALGFRSLVIDSTGFVAGPLGVEFKLQKIDVLRPTHVLALARGGELRPILRACARRDDMVVHRLPVSAAARPRSPAERRANRQERYRRYFTDLVRVRFRLGEVAVWGRWPQFSSRDLTGLLVGLNDGDGFCVGVGLFSGYTGRTIEISLPRSRVAVRAVKLLRFGSVALDPEGNERPVSPREW
ncbi:MAG: Clp1/GlmU family protein [Thermodesulfobacteriota bacterium]|jgi:polynucleotide 5'-hydroxyl-kinase GRC3/NOL9